MTNPNPTTTAHATVLNEDDVQRIESQSIEAYPGVAITDIRALIASHRALTAQVRVLREELRQTDSALAYARDVLEEAGDQTAVRRIDEATHDRDARSALAALGGQPQ